jgi:hypothetical protein
VEDYFTQLSRGFGVNKIFSAGTKNTRSELEDYGMFTDWPHLKARSTYRCRVQRAAKFLPSMLLFQEKESLRNMLCFLHTLILGTAALSH